VVLTSSMWHGTQRSLYLSSQLNLPWLLGARLNKPTPMIPIELAARTPYRATTICNLFCISIYRQVGGSLDNAASHGCADDRDRVYGLLGLASPIAKDIFGLAIVPDYSKTAPQIYRDFALQLIRKSYAPDYPRDLRILQDAGL
jgi:hypothetical protein